MGQIVVISPKDAAYPKDRLATWFPNQWIPRIGGEGYLEILPKEKGPIVIWPERGLEGMRIAPALREGDDQGRVLFLSIAPQKERRITAELSHQRNLLVATLAVKLIFVYISEGGCLEAFSKELK